MSFLCPHFPHILTQEGKNQRCLFCYKSVTFDPNDNSSHMQHNFLSETDNNLEGEKFLHVPTIGLEFDQQVI